MKRYLIVFIFMPFILNAQIINTESLRRVTDTSGWSGNANLSFALTKNTRTIIKLNNKIHVQYKMNDHLVLLVNQLGFERAGGESFINNGSQHLRYNYKLWERITWEAFVQSQYNSISKIKFRGLAGTGPRFKISAEDKLRIYAGTLVMYEYEELNQEELIINRDVRGSGYLTLSYYPTYNLSLISTTYYQPRIDRFRDYRIASESSLVLDIINSLSLKTTYSLTYDAFPATGIPTTLYELATGIVYSFD